MKDIFDEENNADMNVEAAIELRDPEIGMSHAELIERWVVSDEPYPARLDRFWHMTGMYSKRRVKELLDKYFVKNTDYCNFDELGHSSTSSDSIRKREDIRVTSDTVKQVCMMARTEQGRLTRQYFISAETGYKESLKRLTILEKWKVDSMNQQQRLRENKLHDKPGLVGMINDYEYQSEEAAEDPELFSITEWLEETRLHLKPNLVGELGKVTAKLYRAAYCKQPDFKKVVVMIGRHKSYKKVLAYRRKDFVLLTNAYNQIQNRKKNQTKS